MNKSLSLQEFIDLDELQAIQDSFAKTTGVSSVILSPEGELLTRFTDPTSFCSLIQSTEEGKQRCVRSFIEMSKKALEFKELQIFNCFAHGEHFVTPIIINGEHKATMFTGQFISQSFSASQLEELEKIAVDINIDPVQLINEAKQMRVIDRDALWNNASWMFRMEKIITKQGVQTSELQQAKDAVQQAHENLEVRIRQRTVELANSNEELKREIIEHKQTEEALQESENRFKNLFENMRSGVAVYEAVDDGNDFVFKDFNAAGEKMDSINRKDLIGKCVTEVFPGVKDFGFFKVLQRVWRTWKPEFSPESLYKDERIAAWRENYVYRLPSGEIVAVYDDVTSRKQAEEAMAVQRRRLADILRGTNVGTWEWNVQTGETIFNERWADIIGYTMEEISPVSIDTWMKFIHPDDIKVSEELLEKHFDGKLDYYECEARMRHKNGDWVWVLDRGKVSIWTKDGKPLLMSGTHMDITERKQTEKMEAAYTDILTISNKTLDLHTIITEGLDSLMKYTDAQAGAVYLYDPDSKMMVPNVTAGMEITVDGQDFSPGEGFVGEAAQKQEMIVVTSIPSDTIYTIKSGSKHIIPATIICTPMIFKGTLLGVIVTCHTTSIPPDVLKFMKRIIDQYAVALNNANTLLQVQEMAATLKNQRDELEIRSHELEAASRTKSEFLANMSHELRTPLNSIIGFSEILHDGTFGTLNEKQTRYVSNVLISGKHLLELINGILDLAKIESGKMELICEDFKVSEVIDESMMLLSSVASKKNIVLSTAIDKELTTIHVDVSKFKQILYNLMSNAIKFTPKGGSVTVEAQRSGDMAHIAVSDTGIGISKEEQDTLFKPFVQIDSSTSRKYQGTGLGLSLVKQFVEMHGGRVWIESEPDRGSTFIFTIPIKKDIIV